MDNIKINDIHSEVTPEEKESKPIIIRNTTDLQRLKLEKLMKNPEKPVIIPEKPKERGVPVVPDFVRNVMGSSAGAGSGEFHVYRHLRRKEYARQKYMKEKGEREKLDKEYHEKLEENKKKAQNKTAKKRQKRLKRKQKQKTKKPKTTNESSQSDNSDTSSSEAESETDINQSKPNAENKKVEVEIKESQEEVDEENSSNESKQTKKLDKLDDNVNSSAHETIDKAGDYCDNVE